MNQYIILTTLPLSEEAYPALFSAVIFSKLGLKVLLVAKGFDRNGTVSSGKSISYAISPSNIGLFTRCGLKEQFSKMSEDVLRCTYSRTRHV